jgi:hypothetical protein
MKEEKLAEWMDRFSALPEDQKVRGTAEAEKIRQEIRSYIQGLESGEKAIFQKNVMEEMYKTREEARELTAILESQILKKKLEPILGFITLSEIATKYFNRPRHWLYARINGNIINGKPVRFTDDELNTFQTALRDIAERLVVVSQNIR